ncbi:MAG: hypothetical protein RIR00_1217 [Pseudomonadota bacterium]|jgi:leader peptidase (prepilin peptidase)/N-methyltransferase
MPLFPAEPALFTLTCALLGLTIGSFLNVVIHRLPLMLEREWRAQCHEFFPEQAPAETPAPLSLVAPRSRCPACARPIAWYENIPILSYLWLRGRCAGCQQAISLRYPLVEAGTALLSAAVASHFGPGWTALCSLAFCWFLIALALIDFDTQLLPDDLTLPLLWLGLLVNLFGVHTDLGSAVIGAMAGYLTLWSVYWLFRLATGKEGMGFGDFKLLAALGAWLGWAMLPLIILLSSVVGAVFGVALIVLARRGRQVPMPFGPYLACAGLIALFWGPQLTREWLQLMA